MLHTIREVFRSGKFVQRLLSFPGEERSQRSPEARVRCVPQGASQGNPQASLHIVTTEHRWPPKIEMRGAEQPRSQRQVVRLARQCARARQRPNVRRVVSPFPEDPGGFQGLRTGLQHAGGPLPQLGLELLGIDLGPVRLKCALLSLKVLKAGVYGLGEASDDLVE